ncbi:histone-lysine N-methyltransferase SETDB1-B-like isoform X2 [Thalassophryne amazonica]|uniref:histone-lysine N-methyltransferase SETDB1-B-like isoform X2 n=1 Tax=Thalassophryne amazonica TaxID=390379 RepID=UPI001471FCE9|nr:histone-lysine N-methyltransferase SETDB1-B-like isoform X2 [Thalassophryne amazonica]
MSLPVYESVYDENQEFNIKTTVHDENQAFDMKTAVYEENQEFNMKTAVYDENQEFNTKTAVYDENQEFNAVYDENQAFNSRTAVDDEIQEFTIKTEWEEDSSPLILIKEAVVVLTRLPEYVISSLHPPTPQQFYSEDESSSSSDSDMQCDKEDSSDSDFAITNHCKKKVIRAAKPQPPTVQQPTPQPAPQPPSPKPPTIASTSNALARSSQENSKERPNLPPEEVKVDMFVLARKKYMRWQRGKIVEIVTKDDGRLKYKICFDEKGKSLVSGHHIAFDRPPKLEQLYIGARVVIRCQTNHSRFEPGILAELPNRKNRMRFLIFNDEHNPVYVGLPLLHLVCRPLENILDDLPEGIHKTFMKEYLNDWPYTHLIHYRVGQAINAELNGVHSRCEVQQIDSSLIQVLFQNEEQRKDWIHRGSFRLEHMARRMGLIGDDHPVDMGEADQAPIEG